MINQITPPSTSNKPNLKNLGITASSILLAFSQVLPTKADCVKGVLGLCIEPVPTCQNISTENGSLKCLPPNTRVIIITNDGILLKLEMVIKN